MFNFLRRAVQKARKSPHKGPWSVKEEQWELDEETIKKFGDEEDTVRVICVYEKGEPSYNFVAKRMWWDEMEKLLLTLIV